MKNSECFNLFLVDDDVLYLKYLQLSLVQHKHLKIHTFLSGEECLKHLNKKPGIIVLDYWLNGTIKNAMNGIDTLIKIKKEQPYTEIIMLSAQDSIDVAVSTIKHGAYDYIVKNETAIIRLLKLIDKINHLNKTLTKLNWYIANN